MTAGYAKTWELAPDELIGLDGASGTTLSVTRGTLWLTLEDDTRDVVLSAGDTFVVDRDGLTLMQAQGRTMVRVLAHRAEALRFRLTPRTLGERLWRWFGRLADAGLARRWAPYA